MCAPRVDACSETQVPLVGGGCEAVGVDACGAGFVADGRGGCAAAFPLDCPAGTLGVPGHATCTRAGIETCVAGSTSDGAGSCVLPRPVCAAGLRAGFGEKACRAVAACTALADATLFVDSAAPSGGDGSKGKPFQTIAGALAVAKDGDVVGVAAGTYAEHVVVKQRIVLKGTCPSEVKVRGTDATRAVVRVDAAGAVVEGLAIGDGWLGVQLTADATIQKAWIHDTTHYGVSVGAGTRGTIKDTLIENATGSGIRVAGADLLLEDSEVRGTAPLPTGLAGQGIQASPSTTSAAPTNVTVRRTVVAANHTFGVDIKGTTAVVESSWIGGTRSGRGGENGFGVFANDDAATGRPSVVTLRDTFVVENRAYGVAFYGGASGTLERVVVRDTRVQGDGTAGVGISAQSVGAKGKASLRVSSSVVDGAVSGGISAISAPTTIERTIVRNVGFSPKTSTGGPPGIGAWTIAGGAPQPLVIRDTSIEHVLGYGISANPAELTVENSSVRDITTSAGNPWGGGISVTSARGGLGSAKIVGSRVDATAGGGVLLSGLRSEVRGCFIRATSRGITAQENPIAGGEATLQLEDTLITGVSDVAVLVLGSTADILRTTIADVSPGAAGINGFGVIGVGKTEPSVVHVRSTSLFRCANSGPAITHGQMTLSRVLVVDTKSIGDNYGDGIMVTDGNGPATLTADLVRITRPARAGLAVFGATASLSRAFMDCAPIPLNAENNATLTDGGGVLCSCGDPFAACRAQATKLRPATLGF